jgi:LysR family hydrogen peroxide-inducible transcriptional activator
MQPTIRQLQYLSLLHTHQGFQRAAEAAGVSQPALSSGLAELEKVLEVRLVDRTRGRVILTKAGEEALVRARDILSRVEALIIECKGFTSPLSQRFRLGVIPTIAPFFLPQALRHLKTEFPELKLFLREDQTSKLLSLLNEGLIDAAIIALPYEIGGLDMAQIAMDALFVAMPDQHPRAHQNQISPQDLSSETLILLEDGHCLREHALSACALSGPSHGHIDFHNDIGLSGFAPTSLGTLVQMIDLGLGISILPEMAIRSGLLDRLSISAKPLVGGKGGGFAMREISVVWRAGSAFAHEGRLLARSLSGIYIF